jgi:hypothetical protein
MELWLCSVWDCEEGLNYNLGIFSSKEKAQKQAEIFVSGFDNEMNEIDHDYADDWYKIYYSAKTDKYEARLTATIEKFNLDEISY